MTTERSNAERPSPLALQGCGQSNVSAQPSSSSSASDVDNNSNNITFSSPTSSSTPGNNVNSPNTTTTTTTEQKDEDGETLYHASTSSTKTIKEGYLNKQGHLRKNWLQRYFVLTDVSLEYYKDKGQPMLNQIPLSECTISLADTETKKAFCFKIAHPIRKTFYLYSSVSGGEIERDSYEWIGAIQEAIDNLASQLPAVSPMVQSVVTENHRSYELVHAISNALLYSLGKTSAAIIGELTAEDFSAYEQQTINVSRPNSAAMSYKFVDYAPKVFRRIRELSNVNPADYMISLTQDSLTETPSPGRSNSLFYYTSDKKYIVKTISSTEFEQLRSVLNSYYTHLVTNKDTLLVKYYGLHHISPSKMKNTYFVIMENIFEDRNMDEIYDLKGSTLNRKAETAKQVMMDLDFSTRIFVSDEIKILLLMQIENDCNVCIIIVVHVKGGGGALTKYYFQFLEKVDSMDYSLLLGIRYLHGNSGVETNIEDKLSNFKREQGGMIARTIDGECYDRIYYFAIIDILTTYNIKKQLEHTYKATIYDTDTMSAVNPNTYSKRFKQFLLKIIGWNKPVKSPNE
ncbi:hypothetical protein SAMD00019534_092740 [Acytostelium subglobosum LB1]|uniref:hypothetical protein n=1 Tax=Acytostelium subglobosum LB1 TaxID=1410327 RepID=UPI00064486F0|nr:hypothetical protein SAMD00019534_092740 [Acytostelium subglobosum LB1]GAM26099.1 hypothetical protein SAMD00019534_092740 [Acytostelium subglobosum LB1]|eukprot:XP_012751142.1 hypothetical protein SAMD00019534_092740 [Acytostelium subglobosum LB1]